MGAVSLRFWHRVQKSNYLLSSLILSSFLLETRNYIWNNILLELICIFSFAFFFLPDLHSISFILGGFFLSFGYWHLNSYLIQHLISILTIAVILDLSVWRVCSCFQSLHFGFVLIYKENYQFHMFIFICLVSPFPFHLVWL